MFEDIKGKIALITGAGKRNGIGYAIAHKMASCGVNVIIADLCDPEQQNSTTEQNVSKEMLEKAESLRLQYKLNNVTLLCADTEDAVQQDMQFDRIVCNMVLHHVPSPADVFEDCTRLLKKGGTLVVADLCHHDQDWAKQSCGDLWLGFDPEELTDWAHEAGLDSKDSLYLGLRNGFQIQIRRFDKL